MSSASAVRAQGDASPVNVPGRITYQCHLYSGNVVGPEKGTVSSYIRFLEDGRKLYQSVSYDGRDFDLSWKAFGSDSEGRKIDWTQGRIDIGGPRAGAMGGLRKNEWWSHIVVDRDRSLPVHESKGDRFVVLPEEAVTLAAAIGPSSVPLRLSLSLSDFEAWHRDARRLTVYETAIETRKPRQGEWPRLFGIRRIVASYDIDLQTVRDTAAAVRLATEQSEAAIVDSWQRCEKSVEGDDSTIIF